MPISFAYSIVSEMVKTGFLVCLVTVAMDIIAGILGIEAEIAENKGTHTRLLGASGCEGPSVYAFKLGLAAAALLALAHITINLLGGCMCICSPEELERQDGNRRIWFACLIISWIVVAVGFPTLIMGTLENSKSKGPCRVLHHHFLFIGGILCIVHCLLCIAFYLSAATVCFGNEGTNGHP